MLLFSACALETYAADTVTSTSSTVSGTTTVDRTPNTASAPSVVVNNQDVCSFAATGALQTQIFGLAGGTAVRDMNCERLKLSRALYRMGMKVGAIAMHNPEKRPDYEEWKKENVKTEEVVSDEGALGIFSVLLMLFFI